MVGDRVVGTYLHGPVLARNPALRICCWSGPSPFPPGRRVIVVLSLLPLVRELYKERRRDRLTPTTAAGDSFLR
ncbi:hypothetical protein GCM10010472_23310 [Pseudonocardia halophobica]|uniref:Uncharacterized protein n=1 Tax=Pseudonocardia halophobica TaxID=29401 RepID=A0A9W6L1Z0_9PSEU|nr:hypothetical protein GCM10017577_07040 [Pseudonocardia halophobica]